jgi:choline dehydrogenase-like flavoprotein
MATEAATGGASGEFERVVKEIEQYKKKQGAALASMVSKIATYAFRKLEEFFNAPISEVLQFLENNPDYLDYKLLDAQISQIKNPAVRFAITALTRAGGTILRHNDEWRKEFLEQGETFILLALKQHNPQLYELLKDKPKLVSFIKGYIAYKLGL